jgi:pimeloyl-ACP methyl ester carboxylesterase
LAKRFTVICPDLRGYGGSLKPPATPDHAPYAKRTMARDMVELMEALGHTRFLIGSHDRGARVAHRLALDSPDRVEKLAVLDIVPTIEHFERTDMDFALGYYHWFWLAQQHPYPEVLINAAPEIWFNTHTTRLAGGWREDRVPAACAVGGEGQDRPLVRCSGHLAPVLRGRDDGRPRQQRALPGGGGAEGSAGEVWGVLLVNWRTGSDPSPPPPD